MHAPAPADADADADGVARAYPEAAGVRIAWADLPEHVRDGIAQLVGAPVEHATDVRGGFSPGLAARLELANGDRAFVKAVSPAQNPHTPGMLRREAEVAAQLPAGIPASVLRGSTELADGWVVLAFDVVEGRQPRLPWRREELTRVLEVVGELHRALTPAPFAAPTLAEMFEGTFESMRRMRDVATGDRTADVDLARLDPWVRANLDQLADLESRWSGLAVGETLLQVDLRADNILVGAGGEVTVVDWPHAAIGPPWFDVLGLLPSVAMQGGPAPWEVFGAAPSTLDAPSDAVDAALCALAGYFTRQALLPDPPGLPTVRAFQGAQGVEAVRWLRHRLGEPA